MNENFDKTYWGHEDFEDMPDFEALEREQMAASAQEQESIEEREIVESGVTDEQNDVSESEEREEQGGCKVIPFAPQGSESIVLQLMLRQAQDDWDMTKCVEYYVNWVAEQDEVFKERMKSEEKSIKECIEYIRTCARKEIKGGAGHCNDIQVYGWAVHYYTETNETLGIKKTQPVAKKETTKTKGNAKSKTPVKKEVKKDAVKGTGNPLFASLVKSTGQSATKVVKMPVDAKKLTKAELKRGDDCYSLFEF